MSEEQNASVEEKNSTEKITIIKPGFYSNPNDNIIRLVPKESLKEDDHKVRVLVLDEKKISDELKEEIAKDRGWPEFLWKKIAEKTEHSVSLLQRKITKETANEIAFDNWVFVSKKYYPLKKCIKTETWFRATDANQNVCPQFKENLNKELKDELTSYQTQVEDPECNINQLWNNVTKYKNKVVELNKENLLSVRPYKALRKEIQDIYNKAAVKRDLIKKEWEEKKSVKKQHLNDLLEEAKLIGELSSQTEELSGEVLKKLKDIRQKAKDFEAQELLPPWGVQKLFATVAPISKREDEKKKAESVKKKEQIKEWRVAADNWAEKVNKIDLKEDSGKKELEEIKEKINAAKEAGEIGDRECKKLIYLADERTKKITNFKQKEKDAVKAKEKLLKKLENPTLKELYEQSNNIINGFIYNPENHTLLQELLTAADKLEEAKEVKKEDVEAYKKVVKEKLKTEESLKTLSGL